VASLRGADGLVEGFVAIVEDITERKQQLERAAEIQRELLPQSTPQLQGYDLAGACRPAQDVAGDFYDWTLSDDGGQLDLTVADVMGKGLGAGLVMATMRAVLRSAPPELGPAARVRLAAEFLPRGTEDDGIFVTLFQARLDLATGVLRYVDAGHGYGAVRRAGGELVHLTERSLPVGIWPEQEFQEGTVRLEPGDALIVYSDGLVEIGDRTGDLSDYAGELDQAADAQEMVWRLMRHLPAHLGDDVTVLALRCGTGENGWSSGRGLPRPRRSRADVDLTRAYGPTKLTS
jgi:serine phosphatase RsbU (regulator of sigma subunit)